MKRALTKLTLYLTLNAAIYAAAAAYVEHGYTPAEPGASKQVLYFVPRDTRTDLVFLGSSRGRAFSQYGNHGRVEKILDKKIVNLSEDGAGIVPARILLSYFYARGNQADKVLIFLDFFNLLGPETNEDHNFLEDEPLRLGILPHALRAGLRPRRLLGYFLKRFAPPYRRRPYLSGRDDEKMTAISIAEIETRLGSLTFPGPIPHFERYVRELEETAALAQRHGSEVHIVLLPAAYNSHIELAPGGLDRWLGFLELFRMRHNVPYHDFRTAMPDLESYSNPEHLNTAGVELFSARYLKPCLMESR
ncbi:MAG: hypothetical protein ABIJ96_14185 [Elusimicrobiota bacterium]